jgi:hypothetical protein
VRRTILLRLRDLSQFIDQLQQLTPGALGNKGELNTDHLVGMSLPDNALHAERQLADTEDHFCNLAAVKAVSDADFEKTAVQAQVRNLSLSLQ